MQIHGMTYGELLAHLFELSPSQLGDEVSLAEPDEEFCTIGTAEYVDIDGGGTRLVLHIERG